MTGNLFSDLKRDRNTQRPASVTRRAAGMNQVFQKQFVSRSTRVRTCGDVPHFDGSVLRSCEDELVAVRERS